MPLVLSRMSDSATSVMHRCWRTSARTAGAKKVTRLGAAGARSTSFASVGAATTSGGMFDWPVWAWPFWTAVAMIFWLTRSASCCDMTFANWTWAGSIMLTSTLIVERLPALKFAWTSGGTTMTASTSRAAQPRLGASLIGRDLIDDEPIGRARIGRGVGGETTVGREDKVGVDRLPDTLIPETEQREDQERAEDQARERGRPAGDLDQFLADEREDTGDDAEDGHAAAAASGSLGVVVCSTSSAKISS